MDAVKKSAAAAVAAATPSRPSKPPPPTPNVATFVDEEIKTQCASVAVWEGVWQVVHSWH